LNLNVLRQSPDALPSWVFFATHEWHLLKKLSSEGTHEIEGDSYASLWVPFLDVIQYLQMLVSERTPTRAKGGYTATRQSLRIGKC
jgi:hypothetical protein